MIEKTNVLFATRACPGSERVTIRTMRGFQLEIRRKLVTDIVRSNSKRSKTRKRGITRRRGKR